MLSNIALHKDSLLPSHAKLCTVVIPRDDAVKWVLSVAIQILSPKWERVTG